MAAVIKALNAKIRSNPTTDYLCSTHFWGPASNFGIPLAAVMDTQKPPELISGPMTGALILYAGTFMRYALAVQPRNWLLFGCHFVNFGAQSTQGYRYLNYWNFGGREQSLKDIASKEAGDVKDKIKSGAQAVENKAAQLADKVRR